MYLESILKYICIYSWVRNEINYWYYPSLPDVLCDPSDLIWWRGTPFEVMTDHTAPLSDGLLAKMLNNTDACQD